ncbi:sensor histidine kinase [Winogradskyella endarachnes]|uniref:histidine kinase n=1 Tax=Winogradskyella endarachnes TaxID=2681965 RepID=A0A6L6U8E6_9FLAO|nr:HAMP domain-containing sensor histidine kinase [Winogradskyella endarachnes]MUU77806.1 GHKL domain-containing protein [Winogradskyella endarachnes]
MNAKTHKWILYAIVALIMTTICIQIYWNFKNYQANKQQLINDVQVSLDKAVDDYYAALAERTTIGVFLEGDQQKNAFKEGGKLENFFKTIDKDSFDIKDLDSLDANAIKGVTIMTGFSADSMSDVIDRKLKPIKIKDFNFNTNAKEKAKDSIKVFPFKNKIDSIKIEDASEFEVLTSKIVVSINNDSLDLVEIDSLVNIELLRKKLYLNYNLHFYDATKTKLDSVKIPPEKLSTTSKSTFLPKRSTLYISFSNETITILKRSLGGILVSTLLVLAVISCLFFLLKIIRDQKQLAEVKNDLISNITHEFKTPIATISAALESINNFNAIEDKEKTKKYLKMSSEQLEKLNVMVEKILETATLDSNNLDLKKEKINLSELLLALTHRYKVQFLEKTINSNFQLENIIINADIFHIENALNNIFDNAIKYGGKEITVALKANKTNCTILISDNGTSLTKTNKEQIFDKFYRVPKGNKHDVKGFGIGLYYTKTIIEKHNGSISLDLNNNLTTFKITLPNV